MMIPQQEPDPDDTAELPALDEDGSPKDPGHPALIIAWDPRLITASEYSELIVAIGDLARSEGGLGIERIREEGVGVNASSEVLS